MKTNAKDRFRYFADYREDTCREDRREYAP